MYIKDIYIGAFGAVKDLRLSFSRGVNLIEGENEAGKSTLCAFIKFIFYGLSGKTKNGAMSERKRFIPFDGNCAYGTMTVHQDGRDYLISRRVTMTGKTTAKDECTVTDAETGGEAFPGTAPCDAFLSMSEGLFARSAYIPQISGAAFDGAEVAKAIENLLFSAEETIDSAKALKILDSARAELLYKNEKGGKLYEARAERDALSIRIRDAQTARSALAEEEEHLEQLRRSERENQRLTDEAEQNIRQYNDAGILIEFDNLKSLSERLSGLTRERAALTPAAGVPSPEDIHAIVRLSSTIRSRSQELDRMAEEPLEQTSDADEDLIGRDGGAETVTAKLKRSEKRSRMLRIAGWILFPVGLLACAVCFAAASVDTTELFPKQTAFACALLSAVLAAAGCVLLAGGVSAQKKLRRALERYGVTSVGAIAAKAAHAESLMLLQRKATEEHLRLREQKQADLQALRDSAKQTCAIYSWEYSGADSLDALADKLSEIRESCAALDMEIEQLRNAIQEKQSRLHEYDESSLRQTLAADPYEVVKSLDIKDLKNRAAFGNASKDNIRAKIVELEKKLIAERAQIEEEQTLQRRLEELNGEIAQLCLKYDAIRLAYEKMEEAADEVKNNVSPSLANRTGELMNEATDGKYDTLWISPDISLSYADKQFGGVSRNADYFSRGTKELAYIALRIALCELFSNNKEIPMIFDESFAALDDHRLKRIFSVIAARNAQSLIFTSQSRDAALLPDAHILRLS